MDKHDLQLFGGILKLTGTVYMFCNIIYIIILSSSFYTET
jgi:hypothetical protein